MKYRAEIDGLRALAVIPVILFHAGFELFSGGFVGVDVFFVISGYLITTILIEEIENNKFSIIKFYERRARRILPSLFFVMLVCIPFAWFWMQPGQMKDFSQSVVAVSFFASNILFWKESDYFSATAEEKPLLHTWSLAVEEQYYLLFPVFLYIFWRFGKDKVLWMIIGLAIVSLLLSEWGWRNDASANFYLAPTRAWELFSGSIAAFFVQKQGVRSNNILSLLGLMAILFSIFIYDEQVPFPSLYALLPVMGVVFLVLFSGPETLSRRILSSKVFVGIGLISYSAYLWHQPLFAFARIKLLEEPSEILMGALSLLSLVLAFFSWKYIENPFRNRKNKVLNAKFIFATSFIGLVGFSGLGFWGHLNNGFMDRFEIPLSIYNSITQTERQEECFGKDNIQSREDWYCVLGVESESPDIFVFGDSHALSILPAMDEVAKKTKRGVFFSGTSGCTPLLNIYALRNDQVQKNCHELNDRVFKFVKDNHVSTIILVARWSYYTDGGYNGNDFSYISLDENGEKSKEYSRQAFEKGLIDTVHAYSEIGVKPVIVLQVPQQKLQPIDIYFSNIKDQRNINSLSVSLDDHLALQKYVNSLFKRSGVETLDFTGELCKKGRCVVGNDVESFYFDDDHLSPTGSRLLVKKITEFLAALP